MFNFRNKIVLITGASSGLGAALSVALGKKGAKIALVARRKEKLNKVAEKVKKAGGKARIYPCDVASYEKVLPTYKAVKQELGEIDAAFLNAGIASASLAQNIKASEARRVMEVNYFGVVYWMEPLLKDMQKKNQGIIAVTSSLAAYRGFPGSGSYAASKAALSTLIESYQIDLLATKVKLVLILPYFMITEMSGLDKKRNMKIWTTANKAAKIIITGIQKGKREIIFPWHFHLFAYLMRIIPLPIYRLLWKVVRRGG